MSVSNRNRLKRRPPVSVASPAPTYQLKITLDEITPQIWRRIHVAGMVTLNRLHTVIQKAMGWRGEHPHEFVVKGRRYGVPEPDEPHYEVEKEWLMTLREAAPVEGATFDYTYDLGDSWNHEILVELIESVMEPLHHPRCLSGACVSA